MLPTLDAVCERDRRDPLARFKARFALPAGVIYLDGNSLGAQPLAAREALAATRDRWRDELIKGWNRGWFDAPERLGELLAPLIGAGDGEVIVSDNITLNLFKLLGHITEAQGRSRPVILSEGGSFPTDGYIAQGFCRFAGFEHRVLPERAELADHLDERVAAVVLSQVHYRTGRLRDMAATTELVHAHGAEVIWDLAHSAGALPVDLHGGGVRYAVGWTYKYLNGGPGAPAFLYVHQDHQAGGWQPLSGWHGHVAPFAFDADYIPAPGITRFRTGTHSALSYAPLEAALTLWQEVDMTALRDKSLALTELFRDGLADLLAAEGIEDITPLQSERGSQVALVHREHGYAIVKALIARGVIGDYREPGLIKPLFDELDLRIIDALAEEGRRPFTQVAEELGVAEATVRARVGRLQRLDAIRFVTDMRPHELGLLFAYLGVRIVGPDVRRAIDAICEQARLMSAAARRNAAAKSSASSTALQAATKPSMPHAQSPTRISGDPSSSDGSSSRVAVGTIATPKLSSRPHNSERREAHVDAIGSTRDAVAEIHRQQQIGISPVFRFSAQNDFKNSDMIIATVGQGGIGLPDRDYYLSADPKYAATRAKYLEYLTKIFELTHRRDPAGGGGPGRSRRRVADVQRLQGLLREPRPDDPRPPGTG